MGLVLVLGGVASPAYGEPDAYLGALSGRLEQVERDLMVLQNRTGSSGTYQVAQSDTFAPGEYDVPSQSQSGSGYAPAYPPTGAQAGSSAAALTVRLGAIEDNLRMLTGRVEEISFQMQQTKKQLDLMASDVEFRFQELGLPPSERSLSAAPVQDNGAPTTMPGPVASAPQLAPQSGTGGASFQGGGAPTSLGTIPQSAANSLPVADGAAPVPSSDGARLASLQAVDPEESYDSAIILLRRGDFPGAEGAFSQFLDLHPKHSLAGNAQYWLGETYYVRGSYKDAADAFLKGYTTYSESPKAPDSLLKLGVTLVALGQKDAACATLGELNRRFPDAAQAVVERAKVERSKAGCS